MSNLVIVRVIASAKRHYKSCQSVNHDRCHGDIIWRCKGCGKQSCCVEGTTDHIELCDDCWAKTESNTITNEITCCICNKPIEGDDLDGRFWLHEKGCQFVQTGGCRCDLECHAECYAGHEDEYAPLFDDEDDTDEGVQP